jgi:site-specific DNA-adenine methylase
MTLTNLNKAPFPWFGGKRQAAPHVWNLLGDVPHYVEPFAGTMAVLLERPHPCNRPYYSETVNDADGFIVNAWRAIQWSPEETAEAASWPVSEADKQARQIACLQWRTDAMLDRLAGDATFHDPLVAGWWLYGVCCQIGAFAGDGPWHADPITGRITKQARAPREPGVSRDRPFLTANGQGVNHAGTREPGVEVDNEFHPVTMPELVRWFRWLAARLRHVRIVNGDWTRVVTTGAAHTIPVRQGAGPAGIFLDPPYDSNERAGGLYAAGHDSGNVADDVRNWATAAGTNPRNRIVIAGYDTEHVELEDHGWTVHEWFTAGYLTGGMGNVGDGHQQGRERLWASPA